MPVIKILITPFKTSVMIHNSKHYLHAVIMCQNKKGIKDTDQVETTFITDDMKCHFKFTK